MRIFLILAAAFFLTGPTARAQSDNAGNPAIPDRSYKLLREDENWTFLRNRALRQDLWDPIKYIPLRSDADDWYLTIGGEVREVWEQIGNDNWGQQPYMNGYFNERYMPYFDIHYGRHVRTFVELKSGLNSFRIGGPRPIDEKKLDFQAGFLELGTSKGANSIALRVGREELEYGSGRLIDVREGPNVRLSFDGFMVKSKIDSWQIDGFAVRPDFDNFGFFDNAPNSRGWLLGRVRHAALAQQNIPGGLLPGPGPQAGDFRTRHGSGGAPLLGCEDSRAPLQRNGPDSILITKASGSSARSAPGTSGHGRLRPKRAIDFRRFG